MNKFGELLAHYRRECRDPIKSGTLSQSALADLLSEYDERLIYSKTQVSNWETGKRKIP
jgi:transcriptional regulator with XRE-family HTH domain